MTTLDAGAAMLDFSTLGGFLIAGPDRTVDVLLLRPVDVTGDSVHAFEWRIVHPT